MSPQVKFLHLLWVLQVLCHNGESKLTKLNVTAPPSKLNTNVEYRVVKRNFPLDENGVSAQKAEQGVI